MSAYRSPGRLTPAAQRLDLLQAWADQRRGERGSQSLGLGESGWHWTDLKPPAPARSGPGAGRRLTLACRNAGCTSCTRHWHA